MTSKSTASEKTVLVSSPDLPVTFKVTRAFRGHLEELEVPETDVFVMTHMNHAKFGKGTLALDDFTGGALCRAIEAAGFKGKGGEHLVVDLDDSPIKHVLLIGLGAQDDVHRTTICAMYRMIVDELPGSALPRSPSPSFRGF